MLRSSSFRRRSQLRSLGLCSALAALLFHLSACTHQPRNTTPPSAEVRVQSTGNFDLDANTLAAMASDDPRRAVYIEQLSRQIADSVHERIDHGQIEQAGHALRAVGILYLPQELNAATPSPHLARAAARLWTQAAKRGDEQNAMMALAILWHLDNPPAQTRDQKRWQDLRAWMEVAKASGDYPAPYVPEQLLLQMTAAFLPSTWVSAQLQSAYDKEIQALQQQGPNKLDPSESQERRARLLYWSIRLDLRRGDVKAAFDRINALESRSPELLPPFRIYQNLFSSILDKDTHRSATLELLAKLDPEALEAPQWVLHDTWSTIEVLSRQLLQDLAQRGQDDPLAQLYRARALHFLALYGAAIPHFEKALPDLGTFEVWSTLADAHAQTLETELNFDLHRAQQHLQRMEAYYQRAQERFPGRPLDPPLERSKVAVAQALFEHGQIRECQALCRSIAKGPSMPQALQLRATIAMRKGQWQQARSLLQELLVLSFANELERQRWSVSAHLLSASLEYLLQNDDAAIAHAQIAKGLLDRLLQVPGLPPNAKAELHMQRFESEVMLPGHGAQASADLHRAIRSAPQDESLYLRAMNIFWLYDDIEGAHKLFERSSQLKIDAVNRVYLALWALDLARHRGDQSLEREATLVLSEANANPWTNSLAKALTQHVKPWDQRLPQTTGTKAQPMLHADPAKQAESDFYEALQLLHQGDPPSAQFLLQRVLDSQQMNLAEYYMAQRLMLRPRNSPQAGSPKASSPGPKTPVSVKTRSPEPRERAQLARRG